MSPHKKDLLTRLQSGNPGWPLYVEMIRMVEGCDIEYVEAKYLGNFFVSGDRLSFSDHDAKIVWPNWLPEYVPALYGMKAGYWEIAGGFAKSFRNEAPTKGAIFSAAGNDEEMGYPLLDAPPGIYDFQSNSSGASFFINRDLEVLYPDRYECRFVVLDSLESFTQNSLRQFLALKNWFDLYEKKVDGLID